jgi:hypothetical protein
VARNVVTLVARRSVLGRARGREARQAIVAGLHQRFRPRVIGGGRQVELDFSKRKDRREAKSEVEVELDRIDPRWRRLFVLYPTESSLRDE